MLRSSGNVFGTIKEADGLQAELARELGVLEGDREARFGVGRGGIGVRVSRAAALLGEPAVQVARGDGMVCGPGGQRNCRSR
jgi:hypothetical protein